MRILFATINDFSIKGISAWMKIETDGTLLYVTLGRFPRATVSNGAFTMSAVYNGETKDVSSVSSSGRTVTFPYVDSIKEITLVGDDFYYNGVSCSGNGSFSWKGGISDPVPEVNVDFDGVKYNRSFKFSYDYVNAASCHMCLAAVYANGWHTEREAWYRMEYLNSKHTDSSFSKLFGSTYSDYSKIEFYLYFACYENSSDDREDYIGLYEYVSPVYTVSSIGSPYAPHGLAYEPSETWGGVRITWNWVKDSGYSEVQFELQRSLVGADYETVCIGEDMYYYDSFDWNSMTAAYRVRTVSGENASPWCEYEPGLYTSCNAYIGINGAVCPASAVYIGAGGVPIPTTGEFIIG